MAAGRGRNALPPHSPAARSFLRSRPRVPRDARSGPEIPSTCPQDVSPALRVLMDCGVLEDWLVVVAVSTVHNATADCRPRTSTSPTGRRSPGGRRSAARVDSERRIGPASVFVRPSMREAVLTVSPCTVYSSRRSEPTFPDMNGPLFKPTPMDTRLAEPIRAQPLVEARETHVDHVPSGGESAIGVVVDLDRRAERRKKPVSPVGDERPALLENRVARLVEVAVERLDHELGRHDSPRTP